MQLHYIEHIRQLMQSNDTKILLFLSIAIGLVVMDVITGWAKSIYTKTSDSDIGTRGLLKHLSLIIALSTFAFICIVLGDYAINMWYALCASYYALQIQSMLENLHAMGISIKQMLAFAKELMIKVK